jgi:glycerophosphoryl diester phosphodiesterase
MLVIGHRGAAGVAPENSLKALQAGLEAGADILEIDVRLTSDGIPVVVHDFHMLRTHHHISMISQHTFKELEELTKGTPILPLTTVLDMFFGVIILNIELKGRRTGRVVTELIKNQYIKTKKDWDAILFSSFKGSELATVRRISSRANLAMLHSINPYLFVAYHRKLQLTAVGFHRLYIDPLALQIAKKAKLFVYVYTVNRPQTALKLAQEGVDGIVTDNPGIILRQIQKHTA